MKRISKKIAIRSMMILFWLAVIAVFLQLPHYAYLFGEKKRLYIATWPLLIDAQLIQQFESETGIKVEITYFERSEELYGKLKATGGQGYDIIFPSDYTLDLLIKERLLKKLDRSKLPFWNRIDNRLLGNYYDPQNEYSIPFFWGVFGIGYNKKVYGQDPDPSWKLLFSPDAKHIVMSDNPRESVLIAAQYLFGDVRALQQQSAQDAVKNLLKEQKRNVDVYTDERVDSLLGTENNPIAFGLSTDVSRAVAHNDHIGFFVPKEGGFYIIDSIAIPLKSEHEDLAYTFINFLYRAEVMNHHMDVYHMYSPLIDTQEPIGYFPSAQVFSRMQLLTDVISEDAYNSIWIDILSH